MLRRAKLALMATGKENDINLQTLAYQVVDFASVGINAASEGDEFRMLLKTCYIRKFEKKENEKKQQQKPRRKERE